MDDLSGDKRFSHVSTDPRFKRVPKSERKVKIDKRFQAMFTDKKFQLDYTVDKRGRSVNQSQSENYKKYYEMSSDSDESESSESENEIESEDSKNSTHEDSIKPSLPDNEIKKSSDEVESKQDDKNAQKKKYEEEKKLAKLVDSLHKDRMNETIKDRLKDMTVDYARGIGTIGSDSSSDEPTSDESDTEMIEHPWGELDKDAETTEEITRRIAICHLDWDKITAKDLMVLFHSFLPADGVIESITIYPSEFGLQRLEEEEQKGPKELVEDTEVEANDDENSEGSSFNMEKLRQYQLNRLKYYYAVLVCNNSETANKLYTECDGMEYESSATKVDMRFIPDDMIFEQEPREECTALPDVTKYQPRLFANSALQQGKVALTWDETDPNRLEFNKKLVSGNEIDDDDLQAYVAASESEDEDEIKEDDNSDPIAKYKSLITNLQEGKKKRDDSEMEITWGVGLSNENKGQKSAIVSSSDELSEEEDKRPIKGKQKKERNSKDDDDELQLLLADDKLEESSKKHFSLKSIQKQEKLSKKKKKKEKLKEKTVETDNFKVDVTDNRFSALYTSHHYNIDPADPRFRKTKAMEEFITEKQKRRKLNVSTQDDHKKESSLNPELSRLVKSIKSKTKTS